MIYNVLISAVPMCSVVADSCDPMDCSPPCSSVHGIFQARILEWVTISFFKFVLYSRVIQLYIGTYTNMYFIIIFLISRFSQSNPF